MTHYDVYKNFAECFPQLILGSTAWFPNGKNCVRIKFLNKEDLVFTFYGPNSFELVTVDRYFKGLKGRTKM